MPKTERVETGNHKVDDTFRTMINEYSAAYARFLFLLETPAADEEGKSLDPENEPS